MTTLREARRARKVRRGHYDILLVEPEKAAAAKAERDAAKRDADKATGKARDAATARLAEAQAAFDGCYFRQWFEPIPSQEKALLLETHPTSEAKPGELWGYIPALIAACAVSVDENGVTTGRCPDTAEEWAADIATWAEADLDALWSVVADVQNKPANTDLGKG